MVTAYFDESESGNKFCVVGGFVSTPDKWTRFSEECEGLKSEFAIPHFHSVKLFSTQSSLYKHLTTGKRVDLLHALCDLITRWAESGLMATIVPRAYNTLTTKNWRSANKTYYAACFYWLLIGLEESLDKADVHIILEAGHKHEAEVKNLLGQYKLYSNIDPNIVIKEPHPLPLKLKTYESLTKEDAPPLWAADLLSYCFNREVVQSDPVCRQIGRDIQSKIPIQGICIDDNKIELMKYLAAFVLEDNKIMRAEMHEMTKILNRFGVKAVRDKRGHMFDFEGMTLEQRQSFEQFTKDVRSVKG